MFTYRHDALATQPTASVIKKVVTLANAEAIPATCPETLGAAKKVGIQAGHWRIDQLPDELSKLQWDYGASAAGVNEVDVNLNIAQKVAALLKSENIAVDILPATIPEDYCANAFIAIHADGNDDSSVYGYKVAPSQWDSIDSKAQSLSDSIEAAYGEVTGMYRNPTITDNMTQYYAFNYSKFIHSIDPKTPGALIELGFITNSIDRSMFKKHDDMLAEGVAKGIRNYLEGETTALAKE
ncbi:MAG: N-acetylmuramoyl-L-alanine amidase [bacterium]